MMLGALFSPQGIKGAWIRSLFPAFVLKTAVFLCLQAAEKLRVLPEEHYKTREKQERGGGKEKEDGGK